MKLDNDGFKQTITRANRTEFGFTPEQMRGLTLISGHLATAITDGQSADNKTVTANAADPFGGQQLAIEHQPAQDIKRKSIWERVECNQAKKQKKEHTFIQNLGFTHQQ
jgi:hypothetical protein